METFHASPGREDLERVLQKYRKVFDEKAVCCILEALPYMAGIVNQDRQFVYVNHEMLKHFAIEDPQHLLGLRFGEVVSCISLDRAPSGCGTSENCRQCGLVNALMHSIAKGEKVVGECRLTSINEQGRCSWELEVSASPLSLGGLNLTILSLVDISYKKRKETLERLFFHDVMNTAGGLDGLIDYVKEIAEDPGEVNHLLNEIGRVSKRLLSEISTHKQLVLAESGNLKTSFSEVSSLEILSEVYVRISHHSVAKEKKLKIASGMDDFILSTDSSLLCRVIENMAKNALEASCVSDEIVMGCECNQTYVFYVENPGEIPQAVRAQLFMRSFTTKGSGRGLGTYSMKLFGEKYLGGEVDFSCKNGKTRFQIALPKGLKNDL